MTRSLVCLISLTGLNLLVSATAAPRFLDIPIVEAGSSWNPNLPAQQGSIAVGPDGHFHLAYWLFDTGEVYYRNWTVESGLSDPIQIATPLDGLSAPPTIAVDPRGTVHIAFVSNGRSLSYTSRPRGGTFQGSGLAQNNWRIAQPSLAVGGTVRQPRVGIVYLARKDSNPNAPDAYEVIYAEKNNAIVAGSPWTSKVIDTTHGASESPVAAMEQTAQQTVTIAYITNQELAGGDLAYKLQTRRGSVFDNGLWTTQVIDQTDDPGAFGSTISLNVVDDVPGQEEVGFSLEDTAILHERSGVNREWFVSKGLYCTGPGTNPNFGGSGSFENDGDLWTLDVDWTLSGGACYQDHNLLIDTRFLRSGQDMHVVHVRIQSDGQSNAMVAHYIPPGQSLPVDQQTIIAHPLGNRTLLARAAVNDDGRIAILHGRKVDQSQPEMILSVLVFDEDDMDHDGATALFEEAMGSSDTNPNDSHLWAPFLDTAEILTGSAPFFIRKEVPAMAFQRSVSATVNADGSFANPGRPRCIPEVSTDMQTWLGGNALLQITDTFPNLLRPGWEIVRYSWPNGNVPDRVFFRLRAEENP